MADMDNHDSAELGRVIKAMPIQGAFSELRIEAHVRDGFRWEASDCVDFLALASIAPLVDTIVVDKRTYNLANAAGLRTADATLGIHRRLATLCEHCVPDSVGRTHTFAAQSTASRPH